MSNPKKKEKIASIQIPNTMRTDLTGNKRKPTDHGSPRPCKKSNTDDGDDNKNKNTNDGDDNKKGKGFVNDGETHVCSVCQEVMSWNSIRAPALLVCGHVATCVSCYDTWNKGKLIKYCPICKIGQTIAPIRVDLGNTSKMNQYFQMDIMYLACVTMTRTPITISCTLNSTGEEIKKSAAVKILLDKKINYPEEFQKLSFRTQNKTYILHGNTTLHAIGFQKSSHTLFIYEAKLPFQHKIIQDRLQKMECSPNTEYIIRLRFDTRAAKGLEISDIDMTVRKNQTIKILKARLNQYLIGKYYTMIVGKKLAVEFPKIGVLLEAKLTLEELKINTTSILTFNVFD